MKELRLHSLLFAKVVIFLGFLQFHFTSFSFSHFLQMRLCRGLVLTSLFFTPAAFALEMKPCLDESNNEIYGAECATIAIPAKHDGSDGDETLDVFVTRVPSIRDTDKPAVIFIAGGPGQASTDLMPQFRHVFSSLLIDHDFIFVDQRGTGKSHPLDCDEDFLTMSQLSASEQVQRLFNTHKACREGYTKDLTLFSTPHAVKDLEFVKNALGYSKVALWGGSYGTRVALEYIRQFPDSLSAVVIDGVAPTAITLPFFTEQDADNSLKHVLSQCKSQTSCAKAFPNLETQWLHLQTRLKETPLSIQFKHPRTEEAINVLIDDRTLSAWVRAILYSRDFTQLLPQAMYRATQNDFQLLFTISTIGLEGMGHGISEGLQTNIICMEDASPAIKNPPTIERASLLNLSDIESIKKVCSLYPKGNIPKAYYDAPNSNVPTLILSGKFDPVTPPHWGDLVEKGLTRSRHIVIEGGHHFVSLLGCTPDIISEFIDKPISLNTIDTNCVKNITPTPFFIDNAGPSLTQSESAVEATP